MSFISFLEQGKKELIDRCLKRMSLFLVVISIIAQTEIAQTEIRVDIKNINIPWYKTAEYGIEVNSEGGTICPDWNFSIDSKEEVVVVEHKKREQTSNKCIVQWYIDPLKAGIYLIPPASVKLNDGREIKTSAFILNVREPTPEEISNIHMIEDIFEPDIKNPSNYYLKFILFSALLGIVLIVSGFFLYKYLYPTPSVPVKVELPWEKALRRLKELKSKDLPSQGLYEPYYIQLSWILRYYIEDCFHIRAPELTTQEFIETALKDRNFPSEHQNYLIPFLRHCDMVKFAKLEPTLQQMEESFKVVWNFVERTSHQSTENSVEKNKT